MNQTAQISASQQRQRIPTEWQIEFRNWTDSALLSLIEDDGVSNEKVKAYALWELEYRVAFDVAEPKQPQLVARDDGRELDEIVRQRLAARGATT